MKPGEARNRPDGGAADVVTLGETMVLMRSARPGQLAHAGSLDLGIGGAESNVAGPVLRKLIAGADIVFAGDDEAAIALGAAGTPSPWPRGWPGWAPPRPSSSWVLPAAARSSIPPGDWEGLPTRSELDRLEATDPVQR